MPIIYDTCKISWYFFKEGEIIIYDIITCYIYINNYIM